MISPKWSTFLTQHPQRHQLEGIKEKIINIFQNTNNDNEKIAKIATLAQSPSTVILTLNAFNNSIITSFHHEALNLVFTDETLPTIIALTGLGPQAIPIHLHAEQLFHTSPPSINTPSTANLMSTANQDLQTLKDLQAEDDNPHAINKCAVLPPSLALPIIIEQTSNPWSVLHQTIKTIATMRPEGTADDDWTLATPFIPILHTLWGFCHPDQLDQFNIHTSTAPATDHQSTSWAEDLHNLHIRRPNLDPLPFHHHAHPPNTNNTTDTINQRFKKAPEESDDESEDTHLRKSWKKIGRDFQQAILFASSPDGETVPEDPSHRLLQLIHTKNGATAARLIKRWHNKLDIVIQTGMATNITKGMLTSTPDEFTIDTFSPFFTPPLRAGFQNISNDELNGLELSQHSRNLTPSDIKKMTSCTLYIPKSAHELKLQIKNFHAVTSDIITEDALITQDINAAVTHQDNNEAHYHHLFQENKYFGVWFMYRLHYKVQSLLHQCLRVDSIHDVDFATFSIKEELRQISSQNIHITAPAWFLKQEQELAAKINTKYNTPPRGQVRSRTFSPHRDNNRSHDKRVRIENSAQDSVVALTPGESYSRIVDWKSLQKHENIAPKIEGVFMCNNWQMRGYCFSSCKRATTHVSLNNETRSKYRLYVATLRKEAAQGDTNKSPYKPKHFKLKHENHENTGENKTLTMEG